MILDNQASYSTVQAVTVLGDTPSTSARKLPKC